MRLILCFLGTVIIAQGALIIIQLLGGSSWERIFHVVFGI